MGLQATQVENKLCVRNNTEKSTERFEGNDGVMNSSMMNLGESRKEARVLRHRLLTTKLRQLRVT